MLEGEEEAVGNQSAEEIGTGGQMSLDALRKVRYEAENGCEVVG